LLVGIVSTAPSFSSSTAPDANFRLITQYSFSSTMIGSLSCSQQRLRPTCQPLQLCTAAAATRLTPNRHIKSYKGPLQTASYKDDNDESAVINAAPVDQTTPAGCADMLHNVLPGEQQQHPQQHPQQQQRQQQQHWLLTFLQSSRMVTVLAAAALLALLPLPGRRSQALAASLPPPWQTIHTSVSSSSRGSSMQQETPARSGAVQLCTLLAAPSHGSLIDEPVTESSSSSTGSSAMAAVTSRLLGPSSSTTSTMSGSNSGSNSNAAAFPAPSSTASSGSGSSSSPSSGKPSTGSSSSSSSSSNGASAAASSSSGLEDLLAYERAAVNLFAAAVPSVVNITHMRAMQVWLTQRHGRLRRHMCCLMHVHLHHRGIAK
jgi:hypothetical protein